MSLPETANKAFQGAYRKGREARIRGKAKIPPYTDKKCGRHDHIPTFSRAFRRYWCEGWEDADKELIGSKDS